MGSNLLVYWSIIGRKLSNKFFCAGPSKVYHNRKVKDCSSSLPPLVPNKLVGDSKSFLNDKTGEMKCIM